jgi:hypothetical protein
MFDSLADRDPVPSHTRDRLLLAVMVLVISMILFAALYFGAQTLG